MEHLIEVLQAVVGRHLAAELQVCRELGLACRYSLTVELQPVVIGREVRS